MGTCKRLAEFEPVGELGLFSFVFCALQVLTVILILCWLYRQRRSAAKGDAAAVDSLVLPVYGWILWGFAAVEVYLAVVSVVYPLPISKFGDSSSDEGVQYRLEEHCAYCIVWPRPCVLLQLCRWLTNAPYSAMYASVYALNHFVIEGITFLLLQRGAGIMAQRNAALLAGCWALVSVAFPAT